MKRYILLFLAISIGSILFAQESEAGWNGTIRFKTIPTILSIINESPEINIDWVPYISRSIGIPIEFHANAKNGFLKLGLMAGLEKIIIQRNELSGVYLTAMCGMEFIGDFVFIGKIDFGYQLITKNGFLLIPAVGLRYDTKSDFNIEFILDVGLAYH